MNSNSDNDSDIMGALGFCGCGLPVDATEYLLDVLKHVSRLKDTWEKIITYDQWKAEGRKLFVNNGAEYLIYYMLDEKELTEHGGSVPGWLTEKGEQMIRDIEEWQKTP